MFSLTCRLFQLINSVFPCRIFYMVLLFTASKLSSRNPTLVLAWTTAFPITTSSSTIVQSRTLYRHPSQYSYCSSVFPSLRPAFSISAARLLLSSHYYTQHSKMSSSSDAAGTTTHTPAAAEDSGLPVIANNTQVVLQRISAAVEQYHPHRASTTTVQLVAVSKTKPATDIQAIYGHIGHRHFGENYFQEIVEKAKVLPKDIHWHFIGHLQSSKASRLIREVPNLYVIETVDSEKLAHKLNNACESSKREPLNVFIQVDTSGEETKSGVTIDDELIPLVEFITKQCPHLILKGLMTIGAPGDFSCFDKLVNARKLVATHLSVEEMSLELSMGMSGDFEEAIARGATSVRVGSTIFGERIYHSKK